jgi:hypothetical protein
VEKPCCGRLSSPSRNVGVVAGIFNLCGFFAGQNFVVYRHVMSVINFDHCIANLYSQRAFIAHCVAVTNRISARKRSITFVVTDAPDFEHFSLVNFAVAVVWLLTVAKFVFMKRVHN